jgi:hypothetical protein
MAQNDNQRTIPARDIDTRGPIGGDDADGGSVIDRGQRDAGRVQVPDSIGQPVDMDPAFAGTLAGNTTGAESVDYSRTGEREPEDVLDDLGPEGTVVQEIGGEARH